MDVAARNPRGEAQALVGGAFEASVLEPSPPAVADGPWLADDPFRPVAPWQDWVRDHPEHTDWATARWLGGYRPLGPVPAGLVETRLALHRLAVYVLSPARRRVNGKIGLRWTLGGFGTPFFGDDEQVRVEATAVVRQRGSTASAEPLTTLAAVAAFILDGPPDLAWAEPFDVPPLGDPDTPLAVDPAAAAFLGDWYGFVVSVLEALRAEPMMTDVSRVQLWPEHFDLAFDGLAGAAKTTFGASPGDAAVPEPYFYVLPAVPDGSALWTAGTFPGAILPFESLVGADDQRGAALEFLRTCRDHQLTR